MLPGHLSPIEQRTLGRFVERVRAAFGARVERVALFGSRARGEGHEESDLDVLVLLRGLTRADQLAIYDLAYDEFADRGLIVSPFVRSPEAYAELRARERRIALDIEREAVTLAGNAEG